MKRMLVVVCLVVCLTAGCTHNLSTITPDEVQARTTPANLAKMDSDGKMSAVYQGIAPGQVMQDAEGTWMQVPGIFSGITFAPDGRLMLTTPQDVEMEGVEYCPMPAAGQPALKVTKLVMRSTEPLGQNVAAFQAAATTLQGMTQIEAEATVKKWEAAGTLAPGVLDLLTAIILPLLP
jgi:hypothetical protein